MGFLPIIKIIKEKSKKISESIRQPSSENGHIFSKEIFVDKNTYII